MLHTVLYSGIASEIFETLTLNLFYINRLRYVRYFNASRGWINISADDSIGGLESHAGQFETELFILVWVNKLQLACKAGHFVPGYSKDSADTDCKYDNHRNDRKYATKFSFELSLPCVSKRYLSAKNVDVPQTLRKGSFADHYLNSNSLLFEQGFWGFGVDEVVTRLCVNRIWTESADNHYDFIRSTFGLLLFYF